MLVSEVTLLLNTQTRVDTAIALGAAIGLSLAVTRHDPMHAVVAVMTGDTPDDDCIGFLKIPHLTMASVTRSCAGYDDQFDCVEDAVRSFCAVC